tara:strand:- start:356 stop:505 length:150 start_codon:yes stop_codon:yes gene_type:complete
VGVEDFQCEGDAKEYPATSINSALSEAETVKSESDAKINDRLNNIFIVF